MWLLRSETELALLGLAGGGYLAAWAIYWQAWRSGRDALGRLASTVTRAAWIAHVAAFAVRASVAGHLPVYTAYEFTAAFAGSVVLAHLLVERLSSRRDLGVVLLPAALGILAFAWMHPTPVEPLIPILRSVWLKVHVLTAVVAYAAFAATAAACGLALLAPGPGASEVAVRSGRPGRFGVVAYRTAAVGFAFLSVSIVTGAVWAEYVWGRFWSWDPKETWSLVTWLTYAAYLHAWASRSWQGRRAAVIGLAGFLFVLTTYVGVDFLVARQHDFLLWERR